jgi:hypothetical protein
MLIGLQLPNIVVQLGDTSLSLAIGYGLLISLVLIVTRLLCTLGASVFTRFMSHFITVADANPGWKGPVILGWAGMRGVVSLAAALSIPLLINENQPFPQRNLILFITFIVILVTLVLQGLTLPWFIRRLKLEDRHQSISEEDQDTIIRKKLALVSMDYLEKNYTGQLASNTHLDNHFKQLRNDYTHFIHLLENINQTPGHNLHAEHLSVSLEIIEEQRKLLHLMNRRFEFDEDLIRNTSPCWIWRKPGCINCLVRNSEVVRSLVSFTSFYSF